MHSALNNIKLIVKDKIGLDSSTIGDSTLEKIILQRMHQCNLCDFDVYLSTLKSNPIELNELLEIAVIPETWFFRDIKPFASIYTHIRNQLYKKNTKKFKILSIPSSTGEEPYSLAMYLRDKGIAENTFTIDAVDISPRALECAKQGLYGNNSFRGKHYPEYQKKHFIKDGSLFQINADIRQKVIFYSLNILKNDINLLHKFDFILCRNLLIYFDAPTKLIAFKNLHSFLKDDGYLYIGHSEFGSVPEEIFQNQGFEHAFSLIKQSHPDFKINDTPEITNIPTLLKKDKFINDNINKTASFKSLIKSSIKTAPKKNEIHTKKHDTSLREIRKLADRSQLDQAEILCHQHIDAEGESDEALFILGLISISQKNTGIAENLFRKSLFLNPVHYESLIHLSALLLEKGDIKNSELIRKRAHKALQNKDNRRDL